MNKLSDLNLTTKILPKTSSLERSTSCSHTYSCMEDFKEQVDRMRKMAEMLIPHTVPLGTPQDEQDVLILKQRHIDMDGYELVSCLSAADYGKYNLWTLQLQGVHTPFLPFHLVCKLGRLILGSRHLSYLPFSKDSKMTYCWILRKRGRRVLPPMKHSKKTQYEGFEYSLTDPSTVDLY